MFPSGSSLAFINYYKSFDFAVEFYEELVYNKYSRNKEGGKRERKVLFNLTFRVFAHEFADANPHSERRTYMPNIKPVSDLRN